MFDNVMFILSVLGAIVVVAILILLLVNFFLAFALDPRSAYRLRKMIQLREARLKAIELKTALETEQDYADYDRALLAGEIDVEVAAENRYSSDSDETIDWLIPPFEIELTRLDVSPSALTGLTKRVHHWLVEHGLEWIGTYDVDQNLLPNIWAYLSDDRKLIAAIRTPEDGAGIYIEFCFELESGLRGGVANPPPGTVPIPSEADGEFFNGDLLTDFSLLAKMWERAQERIARQSAVCLSPAYVPQFFEQAHQQEMHRLLEAGGLSELDIRKSLELQGISATGALVQDVQEDWQQAITNYLQCFSNRVDDPLSEDRDVIVVHDGSLPHFLREAMIDNYIDHAALESEAYSRLMAELNVMLERFSARDAIARFRPLLPSALRYELIDQIKHPVGADFYVFPDIE